MDNLAVLEQQLKDKIAALEEQRKQEAQKFEQEASERNRLAEYERRERLEKYERKEKEIREKREQQQREYDEQQREIKSKQIEAELANNAAQEAKRLQEEKLEWLRNEISKQEFVEEQHKKHLDDLRKTAELECENKYVSILETNSPTIEYPTAPDNKGEAVVGTEGSTPSSPLISEHLKKILRQAQRTY